MEPARCQFTSLGIHSVANGEKTRATSRAPHSGHGGAGLSDVDRYSSKRVSQRPQRYS